MAMKNSGAGSPGSVVLWDEGYHGHDVISTRTFGFWLYMLSDAMIFATLFAAYAVLASHTAGGPTAQNIVHPWYAFGETVLVFSSVLAFGFSMTALKAASRPGVIGWMLLALVLGAGFLGLEIHEFVGLAMRGIVPARSAFLSSYWALVLTHGLHMALGLIWMLVMMYQVMRYGFSTDVVARLLSLKYFWLFQAVMWVCVFTVIYLHGAI
ncbi:MAG: cytochrome c oxidase subunit 3 [Gammaproteobacteria bacterium]|nr:cytochrome c oxidase subunit 3 [Gammaproteobacteria bacterium]